MLKYGFQEATNSILTRTTFQEYVTGVLQKELMKLYPLNGQIEKLFSMAQ